MKRIGSMCLILILILGMASPAFASEAPTHTPLEKPTKSPAQAQDDVSKWESAFDSDFNGTCEKIMRDYSNRKGVIMEESTWQSFWSSYFNVAQDSLDTARSWIGVDGDVVVPSSVGQQFYNSLTLYIENQYGYKIYPANKYTPSEYASRMTYFSNASQTNIKNALNSNSYFTFYCPSNNSSDGSIVYPKSNDQPYLVIDLHPAGYKSGYWSFETYNSNLSAYTMNYATRYSVDTTIWKNVVSNFSWQLGDRAFPSNAGLTYYLYLSKDTKIFSSLSALRTYLYEGQSIYIMSGLSGRVDDLSVSVNSLSLDYQKYTEEAIAKITQAIQDSKTELNIDTLTEEQLQQVIDRSLGSSLDDLNKTLEDMANQNALDNAEMIQILKLIYNKLDQWDKKLFNDVTTGINLRDLKDLLQVDEDLTDAPKTIMEQLNLSINSVPDKILNGLDAHLDAALDKFFENKLEPLLRELIVPSQDSIDVTLNKIEVNLPFIGAGRKFVIFIKEAFSEDTVPVIYFGAQPNIDRFVEEAEKNHSSLYPVGSLGGTSDLPDRDGNGSHTELDDSIKPSSPSGSSNDDTVHYIRPNQSGIVADNLGTNSLAFDFSWYEPYRMTVQRIIAGFLWLYMLWSIYSQLPRIIDGSAEFIAKKEGIS